MRSIRVRDGKGAGGGREMQCSDDTPGQPDPSGARPTKKPKATLPMKETPLSGCLKGDFYSLYLRKDKYQYTDALSKLDAEILYKTILHPILGIEDLTNNNRIGYAHNKVNSISIKTKVDEGTYKVGFGLLPINVNEMKEIADANLKMPPKTTYIEPKLRSGLTMYEF